MLAYPHLSTLPAFYPPTPHALRSSIFETHGIYAPPGLVGLGRGFRIEARLRCWEFCCVRFSLNRIIFPLPITTYYINLPSQTLILIHTRSNRLLNNHPLRLHRHHPNTHLDTLDLPLPARNLQHPPHTVRAARWHCSNVLAPHVTRHID
jgi:hypothetical protein